MISGKKQEKPLKKTKKIFFDIDLFLLANPQIHKEIDNGTYVSIEDYIESVDIIDAVENSSMKFHLDYAPFDEQKYLALFSDVKVEIDKGNFKSAFDHFISYGYKEIVENKRTWQKASSACGKINTSPIDDSPEMSLLEKVQVKFKDSDSFYAYTLMTNIDSSRYLDANPDVKQAVESENIGSHIDHLLYQGTNDIIAGNRSAYADVSLAEDMPGFVDHAIVVSNHSIYIDGWFFVKNSLAREVYLSNGTDGIRLTNKMMHYARHDLDKATGGKHASAGFYCYVESEFIDIERSASYALVIVAEDGLSRRIAFDARKNPDRNQVSQIILSQLQINRDMQKNMDKCTGIALRAYLQGHQLKISRDDISVDSYGKQMVNPKVSLVVPLYGRIDFVEFQLSQFANDRFFKENAELIYVLDDPRLEKELASLCYGIYPVFEIPFRVVSTHQNCGYAMANNIGASYANAPLVLFFNSDLFPVDKVWLEKLLEIHDSSEAIGAVCPKLIFEDGAIQHAGMVFERNDELDMWLNEHPGKGLPDMNPEMKTRAMPAVTGACMLMRKILYEEVGGMSENYFLGDFEDSDLCLKLHEKGYINYYAPSVKLCHLERQSQSLFSDVSWKGKVTLYNAWQHERKWAQTISTVMKEYYAN